MTFVFGSASVGLAVLSALLAQQSLEIAREELALARDAATSCTPTIRDASMSTAVVKLVKLFQPRLMDDVIHIKLSSE